MGKHWKREEWRTTPSGYPPKPKDRRNLHHIQMDEVVSSSRTMAPRTVWLFSSRQRWLQLSVKSHTRTTSYHHPRGRSAAAIMVVVAMEATRYPPRRTACASRRGRVVVVVVGFGFRPSVMVVVKKMKKKKKRGWWWDARLVDKCSVWVDREYVCTRGTAREGRRFWGVFG